MCTSILLSHCVSVIRNMFYFHAGQYLRFLHVTIFSATRNEKEKGSVTYEEHYSRVTTIWGHLPSTPAWHRSQQFWPGSATPIPAQCCPHQFQSGAIRTNSGSVLSTPILALVLFVSILSQCCLHQFWPGAVCTNSGPVLSTPIMATPILAWRHSHQFWPNAASTNSGPVEPAPRPAK